MTQTRKECLVERLESLVMAINREITVDILGVWNSSDLTYQQIKLLLLLDREGTVNMSEVSNVLGFSKARATSVVDILFEKGLVWRDRTPSDRRVVLCKLTKSGEEKAAQLISIDPGRWQKATDHLGVQQLEQTVRAFETLSKSFASVPDGE